MSTSVVAVHRGTPLKEVAKLLVERCCGLAAIVGPEGKVIGVLSESDLLLKAELPHAVEQPGRRTGLRSHRRSAAAATAGQLMTSPAVTVGPEATIAEAARLMRRARVRQLPVLVDRVLVGIVSRSDLVRVFLRPDGEIRHDVIATLAEHSLEIDPERFHVEVADGIVTLHGRIGRRSLAPALLGLVRTVGGVVRVDARLAWDVDDTRLGWGRVSFPML
jgi:CBS domain-containing protein